ncbi:TF26 protein, partial [Sakesphorus luctuosus]|nr:TF26 protein [Sakesphorus luctuosus]
VLVGFQVKQRVVVIQYADDLLLAGKSEEIVKKETVRLLNYLVEKGLKVARRKLQFVQKEVRDLGHILMEEGKRLCPERLQEILAVTVPKNKREVRKFL